MKLSEFLNRFNLKGELIISYSGDDALKAVERNGYALRYVNPAIFDGEESTDQAAA